MAWQPTQPFDILGSGRSRQPISRTEQTLFLCAYLQLFGITSENQARGSLTGTGIVFCKIWFGKLLEGMNI
jgi:hypothetical protein